MSSDNPTPPNKRQSRVCEVCGKPALRLHINGIDYPGRFCIDHDDSVDIATDGLKDVPFVHIAPDIPSHAHQPKSGEWCVINVRIDIASPEFIDEMQTASAYIRDGFVIRIAQVYIKNGEPHLLVLITKRLPYER